MKSAALTAAGTWGAGPGWQGSGEMCARSLGCAAVLRAYCPAGIGFLGEFGVYPCGTVVLRAFFLTGINVSRSFAEEAVVIRSWNIGR